MTERVSISIDPDACQGNSQCYLAAPEVFVVIDDLSYVREGVRLELHRASITEAARRCPTGAITVSWDEPGQKDKKEVSARQDPH
jgi:ferredoxin